MIPIRDENPTYRKPYLTVGLIVINTLVFIYQLTLDPRAELVFLHHYGVVPAWVTGYSLVPRPSQWLPLPLCFITYQFVHGGIGHLLGNMLYLWIFGNNIEDVLGPIRFIIFYLLGGVIAAGVQILSQPWSPLPMVGASGAIAAVLGAYFLLYPGARVVVLIWFFFFVQLIRVPAVIVLGVWFLMQVLSVGGPGVAWMAHIGGFAAGLLLIRPFMPKTRYLP